jgi:hypothetical protein
MSIDIMATPYKFDKLKKQGFDSALGFWFWNIAVMIAPIDTGNLRSAITLKSNRARRIRISYSTFMANYIKFLEEGQGPVKKYKDFIKKDTTEAIAEQLVAWIITGRRPLFSRQGIKPFVKLSASKHSPFTRERMLLKQANMNANVINSKTRMQISKIREVDYSNSKSSITGKRVDTQKTQGHNRASRGISSLQQIYRERVNQIQG